MLMTPAEETQLGIQSFTQMKAEMPISMDPAANAMLQRVGSRIAAVVSDMPDVQWEFVLFESEEPNAFCLPGGKVGVYTGILPITQNEAGLATVIGHEVAHAYARHGGERMSRQLALQLGGSLVGYTFSSTDPQVQQAAAVTYGLGGELLGTLPHSRSQESEADRIGLLYMARAGYDPEEAIAFWQRFAAYNQQAGGEPLWFLSTHPLNQSRIDQIKTWLPEARAQQAPAR